MTAPKRTIRPLIFTTRRKPSDFTSKGAPAAGCLENRLWRIRTTDRIIMAAERSLGQKPGPNASESSLPIMLRACTYAKMDSAKKKRPVAKLLFFKCDTPYSQGNGRTGQELFRAPQVRYVESDYSSSKLT